MVTWFSDMISIEPSLRRPMFSRADVDPACRGIFGHDFNMVPNDPERKKMPKVRQLGGSCRTLDHEPVTKKPSGGWTCLNSLILVAQTFVNREVGA